MVSGLCWNVWKIHQADKNKYLLIRLPKRRTKSGLNDELVFIAGIQYNEMRRFGPKIGEIISEGVSLSHGVISRLLLYLITSAQWNFLTLKKKTTN